MFVDSIYSIIKNEIDCFPIYKIKNREYRIIPDSFSQDIILPINEIRFYLTCSESLCGLSTKELITITHKIKQFLFKQFSRIIEYQETWGEDNQIDFYLKYYESEKNNVDI